MGIPQLKGLFVKGSRHPLTFATVAFLILLFALFNAEWVFGTEVFQSAEKVLMIYLVAALVNITIFGVRPDILHQSFRSGFKDFAIWTGVAFVGFSILPIIGLSFVPVAISGASLPFVLLIHFAVAVVETMLFITTLSQVLPYGRFAAPVMFGLFHVWAYKLNPWLIMVAIAIGFVLLLIKEKWGSDSSIGFHYGLNLAIKFVSGG